MGQLPTPPLAYRRIRIALVEGARRRPAVFDARLRYLVRKRGRDQQFGMIRE